jgi:hypothetical protein
MQEIARPSEAGFVVDWQITDENPVIDLSTAETEMILPDAATVPAEMGLGAQL